METPGRRKRAVVHAAGQLRVDAVTAEVATALQRAGVASLLLKGPDIAHRLYAGKAERSYVDVDLLVAPVGLLRAEQVLEELGFHDPLRDVPDQERGPHDLEPHAHVWLRSDSPAVDLHLSLKGVDATPEAVWTELSRRPETLRLGSAQVDVPSAAGLAFIVVLHAVQHGRREARTLRDLELAIRVISTEDWREARALAAALGAERAFGAGLSLLPQGLQLADTLGVEAVASIELELFSADVFGPGLAVERLRRTSGIRGKLRFGLRLLLPTPAFMRVWSPVARRGPLGLALAYLGRPFWLLARLPVGLSDWRRAQSAGR